ncbi:MAG: hypothetical protein AAB618_03050 [Patescibacteria group bacterium]
MSQERQDKVLVATLTVVLILVAFLAGLLALYPPHFAGDTATPVLILEPDSAAAGHQLSSPVQRIVHEDNTCAGVVRADGSADGECPPESANLPTVGYDEILPPGRIALN